MQCYCKDEIHCTISKVYCVRIFNFVFSCLKSSQRCAIFLLLLLLFLPQSLLLLSTHRRCFQGSNYSLSFFPPLFFRMAAALSFSNSSFFSTSDSALLFLPPSFLLLTMRKKRGEKDEKFSRMLPDRMCFLGNLKERERGRERKEFFSLWEKSKKKSKWIQWKVYESFYGRRTSSGRGKKAFKRISFVLVQHSFFLLIFS